VQLLRLPVILLTLLGSAGLLHGCNRQAAPKPTLYSVKINNATWMVELAVTQQEQERGLAGRDSLPDGRGMLFLYDEPRVMEYWMKGCRIPLDIAFIDANHKIVRIHTMACEPPEIRFKTYSSDVPALYALEVPAGAFAKAGVKVDDTVTFDPNIPVTAKAPTTSGR